MRIYKLLLALAVSAPLAMMPIASSAQVYVSFAAPPLMPEYVQPPLTTPNSIWTPGYWAFGSAGYYWVPGTWVAAPSPGLLWTPGYWGQNASAPGYAWNQGYWGQNVGYYGGVNYGGGYYGTGYGGGRWYGNAFRYNTAVTRVNPQYIRNVYVDRTVVRRNVYRYSYNGPGGIRLQPTAQQLAWRRERHVGLTPWQRAHITEASQDRNLYANVNHGKPGVTVVSRPLSTTNRPKDFKPLTTADREAAKKQTAKPAPKATAKPQHKATAKPASKPAKQQQAAKPPKQQQAAKPPKQQQAAKPPKQQQAAKPPKQQQAAKPPANSGAKPAPKPPAQPKKPPSNSQQPPG
ncbi:MAG TPA: hypothetical protein VIJ77_06695 [Candidatus Tumulicola sp.]